MQIAEAEEEEYDCQEDGVKYFHRKFPDKPEGYKHEKKRIQGQNARKNAQRLIHTNSLPGTN